MKRTYRFGYLFALVAVAALFACNEDEEENNVVVNDSQFVGNWNLKSTQDIQIWEVLDSAGNVIKTLDPFVTGESYNNAVIKFFTNYTATSIINKENGEKSLGSYRWEDLKDDKKFVLNTYTTYNKVQIDTFDVVRNGNTVEFSKNYQSNGGYAENELVYDEELDSTILVRKQYDAIIKGTTKITIDK